MDSDNTIDVQMTDRFGRPWFMFRTHGGELGNYGERYVVDDQERARSRRLGRPAVGTLYQDPVRTSGVLEPSAFPTGAFQEFMPFPAK